MYEYAYAPYLYSKAFKAYNATRLHASVVFHGKSCVENVDFQAIQFKISQKQTELASLFYCIPPCMGYLPTLPLKVTHMLEIN